MEEKVLASMSDTDQIKARMVSRMRQVSAWLQQAMSQKPDAHIDHHAHITPAVTRGEKPSGCER